MRRGIHHVLPDPEALRRLPAHRENTDAEKNKGTLPQRASSAAGRHHFAIFIPEEKVLKRQWTPSSANDPLKSGLFLSNQEPGTSSWLLVAG